jgi:hypothetical protein
MANFWDNDEVIPAQLPQATEEQPTQANFWDKDEVVPAVTPEAPVTSPRPKARPAQEDRVLAVNLPEEVAADSDFLTKVETVANNVGVTQEDLLRVIQFETAGSFAPDQISGTSSAVGLIQFMPTTAEDLGTTSRDLALLNRSDQMDFVEKYLTRFKGRMKDFGDLYMAVHFPAAVGKDDDYVVYAKDHKYKGRRQAYAANKGMDVNKDGKVTKSEAIARATGGN